MEGRYELRDAVVDEDMYDRTTGDSRHHIDQSWPAGRLSEAARKLLENRGQLTARRDLGEYLGDSTDAARWTDDPGDRGRVAIKYPHPTGIRICGFAIHRQRLETWGSR
jgi:hypothetical protein